MRYSHIGTTGITGTVLPYLGMLADTCWAIALLLGRVGHGGGVALAVGPADDVPAG